MTNDMFEDVDPYDFQKQLDVSEAKDNEKKVSFSVTADKDGRYDAASFDRTNWDKKKSSDCYFKGLNNVIPDGLLHLSDGTSVNCENGSLVNEADM